jgi:hypothetical protein
MGRSGECPVKAAKCPKKRGWGKKRKRVGYISKNTLWDILRRDKGVNIAYPD